MNRRIRGKRSCDFRGFADLLLSQHFSDEQITADSASSVYMIGKSSNTLCYIGDGKLPVWGLLVKGLTIWGIFQRLGAKRQVESGL